jgi:hypothetical protein
VQVYTNAMAPIAGCGTYYGATSSSWLPANVTSVYLESCNLVASTAYKVRVEAVDRTGVVVGASVNPFSFQTTATASGFMITGVTGGIDDSTVDNYMDDGESPIVHWQTASYATEYRISIVRNNNPADVVCPEIVQPGGTNKLIFPDTCFLYLHDDYQVRVVAIDSLGAQNLAANGLFTFKHRVGLYLSGLAGVGGSYYKGVPIQTCAALAVCDATTPYRPVAKVDEVQIRLQHGASMQAVPWTAGVPTVGNGVLDVKVKYLKIEGGSRIGADGAGYPAAMGPGGGISASAAGGGSHAGYAGAAGKSLAAAGVVYGVVNNPDTMGSGGADSSSSSTYKGGPGGGIVNLDVYGALTIGSGSGYISANGADATAVTDNKISEGAGGGAGGSIVVKRLIKLTANTTTNRLYVESKGGQASQRCGGCNGGGGSGSGGRIAFYHNDIASVGGIAGVFFVPAGGSSANSAASGTVFHQEGLIEKPNISQGVSAGFSVS